VRALRGCHRKLDNFFCPENNTGGDTSKRFVDIYLDSQDLALHTVMSAWVATVRQTFGCGSNTRRKVARTPDFAS
jgi:hypothetical protein